MSAVLLTDPVTAKHLHSALRRHVRELDRDGRHVPPSVRVLLEVCEQAHGGPDRTAPATARTPVQDADMALAPAPLLLTAEQAAACLSVSTRTLRRLRSAGELAAVTVGSLSAVRYRRDDVEAYAAGLPVTGPATA